MGRPVIALPRVGGRYGAYAIGGRNPVKRRAARPFTPAELERIHALLDDGWPYKEIARTLDRHAGTILRVARANGWESVWTNTSGPQVRKIYRQLAEVPAIL